jgi:DNA-binding NtrC family response regulator
MDISGKNSVLDPYNMNNSYEEKMKTFETELIKEALSRNNGNQSAAARELGISERHLRSRLERLQIKNNK